ncbi:hypothetical protein C6T56_23975 [Burkholderia multivorans]|uniref:Uncharacterized protein n=1 Tax=Burkholderia multivorans CGD2 TaxID=513052 RepID=B9BIM9_9BURK|nr:hypothetical protein BURMUCGD2_4935 [Burkholderia multivorans CGD2]EEE15485.1 hypothetical protein BURMUCGD2M_4928 [Burkholderia multivorans CGD2M]PRG90298.1 hypothetical protein C6V04_20485 [Burkholderia multivorans]PRH15279.1 hypothetical protein C6T56_23975 [Burkholderia multivorans]PRH18040.1 hypothetical protein C6T53_24910 [Burkholderia multivorans]
MATALPHQPDCAPVAPRRAPPAARRFAAPPFPRAHVCVPLASRHPARRMSHGSARPVQELGS